MNNRISFFFSENKKLKIVFLASLFLLFIQMYFNTGTLSGYAVTLNNPFVIEGYIVNYDYTHYQCNYNFIMGNPIETWGHGWVLRRELFYILSFPLLKLFGLYNGGTIAAFLITLIGYYTFIKFIYKIFGVKNAYVAIALLASYSGIMYWIGSPFAQIMIVPCCCWIYIIMWKMNETAKLSKHLLYLFIISILFTAYDLSIFFYPAIILIYLSKCDWKKLLLSFPIIIIPQILIYWWLKQKGCTEVSSANSGLYGTIIKSYFNFTDFNSEWEMIVNAPKILLSNFLDSSFWFLPLLFLVILVWGFSKKYG